jgi:hypothetical protein
MFEWVAEGGVEGDLTEKFTVEKNRPTITTANLIEDLQEPIARPARPHKGTPTITRKCDEVQVGAAPEP